MGLEWGAGVRWIEAHSVPVREGSSVTWHGVLRDITEQHRFEREARLVALTCRVDSEGKIAAIYAVLAPKKLVGIAESPEHPVDTGHGHGHGRG